MAKQSFGMHDSFHWRLPSLPQDAPKKKGKKASRRRWRCPGKSEVLKKAPPLCVASVSDSDMFLQHVEPSQAFALESEWSRAYELGSAQRARAEFGTDPIFDQPRAYVQQMTLQVHAIPGQEFDARIQGEKAAEKMRQPDIIAKDQESWQFHA